MAFDEVQFPTDISLGSRGGPGYKTEITTVDSGAEQRNSRWATPLRQYDVSYGIKNPDQLNALITFYIARKGAQYGFRYKDWLDYTSAADNRATPAPADVVIGVGDGTTTQFQLIKKYTSSRIITRNITKPVAGSVRVAFDGVEQMSGWTVNTVTGVVLFTSAPSADVSITAGFTFDVPVRFGQTVDQLLQMSWEDYATGGFSSGINLVEIRDGLSVVDDFFMGGAYEVAPSANLAIELAKGRVQVFNPSAGGLSILLPDETLIAPGGPIFYLFNESAHDLAIKYADGTTAVGTLAAGQGLEVLMSVDGSGNHIWYLL